MCGPTWSAVDADGDICANDGGDGREASEDAREEQDERKPKIVTDIKGPTEWERLVHDLTHIPYRPWCRHCVAGRGKSRYHRRHLEDRRGEVPVISMDYGALGPRETIEHVNYAEDGGDGEQETAHDQLVRFVAVKDRVSKAVASVSIPSKGSSDTYVRDKCMQYFEEWGRTSIVLRCDKESSIRDLRRSIMETRLHSTAKEDCPRDEHQANGDVESSVSAIGGQVRTMRAALQDRLGVSLDHRDCATKWLIDYAGVLLTRFQVGEDGRTAFERVRGRRFKKELVEFGTSHVRGEVRLKEGQVGIPI